VGLDRTSICNVGPRAIPEPKTTDVYLRYYSVEDAAFPVALMPKEYAKVVQQDSCYPDLGAPLDHALSCR